MSDRCCLTPKNEFSHHINELILRRLPTPLQQYLSVDTVQTDDPEEAAAYPMEFLNAQTHGGMPLHSLQLKPKDLTASNSKKAPDLTASNSNKAQDLTVSNSNKAQDLTASNSNKAQDLRASNSKKAH
eukprot:gene13178-biopygen10506